VVGFADPQRLMRNDAAAAGDVLFLTKPIGVGVISTAIKRGQASNDAIKRAVETMTALNAPAAEAAVAAGVRGATDVTGFGLLGHLHKMLLASGVGATLRAGSVPLLEDAPALVEAGMVSGGTRRNIAFTEPWTSFDDGVDETTRILLADAQTSGGMLLSCWISMTYCFPRAPSADGSMTWFIMYKLVRNGPCSPSRASAASWSLPLIRSGWNSPSAVKRSASSHPLSAAVS